MTALASLPASGARLADTPSPPPFAPANGRAPVLGGGRAPVALSDLGIKLSQQAERRSEQLGHRTVDLAQDFLNDFARRYLGNRATIAFDSASIATSSSFDAAGSHSVGPDGVQDAASFRLDESAHFIGKGQITTADGQRFDFEIEVQYELTVEASASRRIGPPPLDAAAPPRPLQPVDFGGDLSDLFKLLGRELHSVLEPSKENGNDGGNLTLRLLKLITGNAQPEAATKLEARTKAVEDSYAGA